MSDGEVIDLKKERSERSPYAHDWTVLDALRFAIKEIEEGRWKATGVYVAMALQGESGRRTKIDFSCAGLNAMETKGLLAQHMFLQCDPNSLVNQ